MSKTFWNIWSSYATFYFGRVNLSIVIPVILATYGNLSLYNVGFVASGFMAAYALGQFLHGQISEKYNPFVYISIGLIGSALMNLILGFSAGFFWVLFIGEVLDGGFQSMGWSSIVRANAYTSKNVEKSSIVLGTAYQVGNSIAWIACGFVIGKFGWEWGFWLATVVMFARAIALLLIRPKFVFKPKRITERMKLTISLPILLSGFSLSLLNMVRYGVIIWIPTYLYQEYSMPIEKVGMNIFMIPLAGVLGTLLYNRVRLRKDVLTMIYVVVLALTLIIIPETVGVWAIVLLILGGFLLYGPHVFLVTTIPSRFHKQSIVAAATGFIDGWGYIGSILIGILVPFILDAFGDWRIVFYFWAGISLMVVCLVAIIFIRSKGKEYYGT